MSDISVFDIFTNILDYTSDNNVIDMKLVNVQLF